MNTIYSKTYHSPCGDMILGSFEGKLCLCDWLREGHNENIGRRLCRLLNAEIVDKPSPVVEQAEKELKEYFAGTRRAFDLPLLFVGTDFQKKVWTGLMTIPYGQTISYGAFARKLGCPAAVRAVAAANGANAISIFVPCHRVIGSDNSLTGYGGGIAAKRKLLEIEGALK
jgi:methylated-DNA-[protein]-cysteine S-methyltransferase